MSFAFETPQASSLDTFAGGEADLGSIFSAAWNSARYAGNAMSGSVRLERAYDDRIEAVRKATGITLDHPMRRAMPDQDELAAQMAAGQENLGITRQRLFARELARIAEQYPAARDAVRPQVPIAEDAAAIGREAEARATQLADSRDGAGKWAALFGGAAVGMMEDPMALAATVLGGGPSSAATLTGRILTIATREALINGGTEAAMQPFIQAQRNEIGLPSGLDDALTAIGLSTALGGFIGGAIGGGRELAGSLTRRADAPTRDSIAAALRPSLPDDAPIARALDGDLPAQREILDPIREALPAEARGALDAAARGADRAAYRPNGVDPLRHDEVAAAAERAVARNEPEMPAFDPDPDQVARIANGFVAAPQARAGPEPARLSAFLMRRGGLRDEKGEVSAVTGGQVSEAFTGKIVRSDTARDALSLDRAREMAAEAGYFDRLYGTPDEAMARSTVRDLLDLLDEDLRGGGVRPGTEPSVRAADPEAERAYVESVVADVAREMGPGISDDLLNRAVRLVQDERMDPAEAAEWVLIDAGGMEAASDAAGMPRIPGWSDEDMAAAMAARGPEPRPDGLDDPSAGRLADEDLLSRDDIAGLDDFPFVDDDGNVVLLRDWLDGIETDEGLTRVVEACRV